MGKASVRADLSGKQMLTAEDILAAIRHLPKAERDKLFQQMPEASMELSPQSALVPKKLADAQLALLKNAGIMAMNAITSIMEETIVGPWQELAYALRLQGKGWSEIAAELHRRKLADVSKTTVEREVRKYKLARAERCRRIKRLFSSKNVYVVKLAYLPDVSKTVIEGVAFTAKQAESRLTQFINKLVQHQITLEQLGFGVAAAMRVVGDDSSPGG